MPELNIDQLVLVVVSGNQSRNLMKHLNKHSFYFTIIDSTSSLFHAPTVCLLLGLNHSRMDQLNQLVKKYCRPYRRLIPIQSQAAGDYSQMPILEALEGGAILYGMAVEHFEQI